MPSVAQAPLAGSSPRPPDHDSDVGENVADADSVADTDGDSVADADGDNVADADGDSVADADGDSVADADGDSVAESSDNHTFSAVFP